MACKYNEDHADLRQLLHSLEFAPVRSRSSERLAGKLNDWWFDLYGTDWYKRVTEECRGFLSDTSDKDFDNKSDDSRPELKELQEHCTKASVVKNTIRTPELEKEILRM
jgi:hypothetical protein